MIYILELLNKIRFSDNKGNYVVRYFDRHKDTTKEVNFKDIKFFDKLCFVINVEGYDSLIPLHRIKEVVKDNEIVWRR